MFTSTNEFSSILHEFSFNVHFYETILETSVKGAFGKL